MIDYDGWTCIGGMGKMLAIFRKGNRFRSAVTSARKSFNFRVIRALLRSAPQCYRVFALARINLSAQVGFSGVFFKEKNLKEFLP